MKITVSGWALIGAVSLGAMTTHAQRTQWDGLFTEIQAKRGQSLYAEQCAPCHGSGLDGGEFAPKLTGSEFASNWNGLSLNDLFERIRISMPQNAPGSLTRPQTADILSFMLMKAGAPAGQTEMPTQTEVLEQTQFLAR